MHNDSKTYIVNDQATETDALVFTLSVILYATNAISLALPEIKARRALLICSDVVNTFATSGSITATRGVSFMRLAKRFGFALL